MSICVLIGIEQQVDGGILRKIEGRRRVECGLYGFFAASAGAAGGSAAQQVGGGRVFGGGTRGVTGWYDGRSGGAAVCVGAELVALAVGRRVAMRRRRNGVSASELVAVGAGGAGGVGGAARGQPPGVPARV